MSQYNQYQANQYQANQYQASQHQGWQTSQPQGYHQASQPQASLYRRQNVRRKSLLIGINYEGQKSALRGCRQDVRNMVQGFTGSPNVAQ